MTINADALLNQTMMNTLSSKTKDVVSTTATFETELQRQLIDNLKSQQDPTEVQSDAELENFKRTLSSRGALAYLQEQNLEKIKEMIEKKKEELKESLGLGESAQPPLSGEDKATALQTLDKMLSDYTKQLMEQLQDQNQKGATTTALSTLLQKI
ncbi:MAG: hypothetical protein PHR87_11540 [Sulfurospirillaceae bacterium]|nr:hypothetical protein [Sulfurospirillaceae bacterium]